MSTNHGPEVVGAHPAQQKSNTRSTIRSWVARWWPWLTAAVLFTIGALVHRDFGITWDEGVQSTYGELVVEYFATRFDDVRNIEYLDLRFYGPLVESAFSLVYDADEATKYDVRHLLTAGIAVLAVPGIALLCRVSGSIPFAILSVISLLVQPRFIGHAFGNSKDIPLAVATIWFVLAAVLFFRPDEVRATPTWLRTAMLALASGVALATRPGAFPILVVLFVAIGLISAFTTNTWSRLTDAALWLRVSAAWLVAWIVMVISWPWAHQSPILNPIEAIVSSARYAQAYPVRFAGEIVTSTELPWTYLPTWFVIATPLAVLAFAAIGAIWWIVDSIRRGPDPSQLVPLVAVAWVAIPVLGFVLLRPNVYDGLRHALFVLPGVAILAGAGADIVRRAMTRVVPSAVAWVAVVGVLLISIPSIVTLHPYQYVYFNELAGGVASAQERFEGDYWVASYDEALAWIAGDVQGDGPVVVVIDGSTYISPIGQQHATESMRIFTTRGYQAMGSGAPEVDYWVVGTRAGWGTLFDDYAVVHEVTRNGAVLSTVRVPAGR